MLEANKENDSSLRWVTSRYETIIINSKRKRKCLMPDCEKVYAYGTSHLHLKLHWTKQHKEQIHSPTQFLLHNDHHNSCLLKMILEEQLPYQFVSRKSVKEFVRSLNPKAKIIDRMEVSMTLLQKADEVQKQMQNLLKNATSVSLTCDLWTASNSRRGFAAMTAHYITNDMILEGFTLEFKRLHYPHDSKAIANFLIDTIKAFGIQDKVISITSDNDSAIKKAVDDANRALKIEDNFGFASYHLRCLGHVVHLAAKSAIAQMRQIVSPIKSIVLLITNSIKHSEEFDRIQETMIELATMNSSTANRKPLKLVNDCETRWNSTLFMLERAYLLRNSIDHALSSMKHLRDLQPPIIVDWEDIKMLIDFLRPCYDLTIDSSGENYVAISTVVTHTPLLSHHAHSFLDHPFIGPAAKALSEKLNKYADYLTNDLTVICTILDPRIKMSFLDSDNRDEYIKVLEHHLDRCSPINLDESTSSESSQLSQAVEQTMRGQSIYQPVYRTSVVSGDNELTKYLTSERSFPHTNLISYWRANQMNYPRLAKLARNLLCVQATSVASERVFSVASEIDIPRRNSLADESFRANMLLRSWFGCSDLKFNV